MKQYITDHAQAEAIARQIGAWPAIAEARGNGCMGLLAGDGWIFAFDADGGLIAVETSSAVEQGLLTALMAAQIDGPLRAEFPMPSWPTTH
jgi:hypothetical protein